jgi:putative endonuclease
MKHHLATGKSGEEIARRYLVEKGYQIVAVNWRYRRAEIDIIASKPGWLIFVEVKTRSGTFYGSPDQFVDRRKQRLIVDAAVVFMNRTGFPNEFRFDIISIVFKNPGEYGLRHFEDAFFPGSGGF